MDGDDKELEALESAILDPSAEPLNLTLSLLKRITNNFCTQSVIDRGGFSVVYKGKIRHGLYIAVKSISQTIDTDDRAFIDEIISTMRAKHKNTVRLIGYCADRRGELVRLNGEYEFVLAETIQRFICLEYVPSGILRKYIKDEYHELGWGKRYQIIKGVCDGLHHLHETARIIHADLKPDNILLEDENTPKIFDFGLSNYLNDEQSFIRTETIRGTPGYMAPEMLEGQLSFKSDIFALGVMIIEFLSGSKQSDHKQVHARLRQRFLDYPSRENKWQQVETCLDIGFKCMNIDPRKRPTATEIIQWLGETENVNYSKILQAGDEESVSSYSDDAKSEIRELSDQLPTYHLDEDIFGNLGSDGYYEESGDEESVLSHTDVFEQEEGLSNHHMSGGEDLAPALADVQTSTWEHEKELDQALVLSTSPVKSSCLNVKEGDISQGQAVGKLDESELVYKQGIEPEKTTPPMDAQTSTQEHIQKRQETTVVCASPADLSSFNFLQDITDRFSVKLVVGNRLSSSESRQEVDVLLYHGKPIMLDGEVTFVVVKRFIVRVTEVKFARQAEILKNLDHTNIVKLMGYCQQEEQPGGKILVMYTETKGTLVNKREQLLCYEYMPSRSLREHLFGQGSDDKVAVDWDTRYKFIKGTCAGLEYLHDDTSTSSKKPKIAHLSLSLSQVLLDNAGVPRITGFDVSTLTGEETHKENTIKLGKRTSYMDRTYMHGQGTKLAADIYSLGIIILEIVTKERKHDDGFIANATKWEHNASRVASEYGSSDAALFEQVNLCITIGLDCVEIDPKMRPTAADVMHRLNRGVSYVSEQRPKSKTEAVTLAHTNTNDPQYQSLPNTGGNEKSGNTSTAGPLNQKKFGGIPYRLYFQKRK